ncbi:urea ABC transporter permease subunit UrtB [Marinomonas epiphytica]
MRHLIALCCCLFGALSFSVNASQPSQTNTLLAELTGAKLKEMAPILEQLATNEGESILPLFETLLAGDLYYLKANKQVLGQSKDQGTTLYKDIFSQDLVTVLSKRDVKKIRVNNKLRSFLRSAIARIQLTSADPDSRESAVQELLSQLTPSTIELIEKLYLNEQSEQVKEAMEVALAIHTASTTELKTSQRIQAIQTLSTSLESEVRNSLIKLTKDPQPSIASAAQTSLDKIAQRTERFAFLDQLFFGLSLGSVLLLASIGLAITFGVMGVINMAHGEMIMLGAYTTYVVQLLMPHHIDYSIWVAIPAAFLVSGLMGVLIERLVIRHLHGRPLETLLATFGISLILQQLVRTIFSPLNRQVSAPSWMSGSWEINPVLSLTLNRLYILAFALLVFFALVLILKKTSLGLNVRAVSQNRNMAKSMGVKTHWVDAMTFGLGSGIAGIAGVALSQLTNVGPNLGQAYIIDSFMVVVFGGVGNLLGTLVAAFSLGIATKFLEPTTGAVLAAIIVLVFIILFIQKRPKGLFPQKGRAAE